MGLSDTYPGMVVSTLCAEIRRFFFWGYTSLVGKYFAVYEYSKSDWKCVDIFSFSYINGDMFLLLQVEELRKVWVRIRVREIPTDLGLVV